MNTKQYDLYRGHYDDSDSALDVGLRVDKRHLSGVRYNLVRTNFLPESLCLVDTWSNEGRSPKRFGNPGNIGACLSTPYWDGDPVENSPMPCVEEFRYFSRIAIGERIIGFDQNGTVVSKSYSSSP
jgi:hypothetical protein